MLGLGLGLNDHVHATLCPLQDLHTFRAWISMARTNRFLKIQWTQSAFGCSSTEWRLFLVYTVWRLGHPNINHSLFHCFPYLLVGEHPDTSTPICLFSLFDSCNPSGQEPLLDRSWEAPKKACWPVVRARSLVEARKREMLLGPTRLNHLQKNIQCQHYLSTHVWTSVHCYWKFLCQKISFEFSIIQRIPSMSL